MKKKTFIRVCVLIILAVVLIVMIKFYCDLIKDKYSNLLSNDVPSMGSNMSGGQPGGDNSSSVTKTGAKEFTSDDTSTGEEYTSSNSDENAILVKDGANISISGGT